MHSFYVHSKSKPQKTHQDIFNDSHLPLTYPPCHKHLVLTNSLLWQDSSCCLLPLLVVRDIRVYRDISVYRAVYIVYGVCHQMQIVVIQRHQRTQQGHTRYDSIRRGRGRGTCASSAVPRLPHSVLLSYLVTVH